MKTLFKLFTVAIAICFMTTACEKESEDRPPVVDDTTGATVDADQDEIPINTVRVSFNDETWDAATYIGALSEYDGCSVAQILAQKDADMALDATQTVRVAGIAKVGTEKAKAEYLTNEISSPSFDNPNIFACDYFQSDYLSNASDEIYGNWWAKEVKWKVTDFDATTLKMQVEVKAEMFDASAVLVDGVAFEDATTTDLKVKANVSLEKR